jgi:cytoskeletal protein RodZ
VSASPTFGAELQRARELRGIGLREIAEATKVNLRHLEALEKNRFDELPGGIFNRGMIRAYCDHIGIDADVMLTAYLDEERGRAAGGSRSSSPELLRGERRARSPQPGSQTGSPTAAPATRSSRLWLAILAAVVLAALAAVAAGFLGWMP